MLDLHGYDYKDIYTPAPRHTIGKVRFRTPAEAWRLLDNKFNWPDRWMNIERTRSENDKRRPITAHLDSLNMKMNEIQQQKLQHDFIRGIMWFAGTRIVEQGPDGLFRWRQLEGLPDMEEVKSEHARKLASGRM